MFAPIPITAKDAGARLGVSDITIRTWGSRYSARKLGSVGRRVFYDLADLLIIDLLIRRDIPIPPRPEERDLIRLEIQLGGELPESRQTSA